MLKLIGLNHQLIVQDMIRFFCYSVCLFVCCLDRYIYMMYGDV